MNTNDTENLRASIQASGLTTRQIAERGGLSFGWVAAFRRGAIANPGVMTLERLRVALGAPHANEEERE